MLVPLVIGLTALASLGTALLAMATSARYQRLHFGNSIRAYYLAESGGSYVRSVRMHDKTLLPSGTFTMANGDLFSVHTTEENGRVVVTSIGTVNPETHLEAQRRLHFEISENPGGDVLPVGFDLDNDGQFDSETWSVENVGPTIRDTGPSGGQAALDLKGEEGAIFLNWQDKPDLDLAQVWAYSGGLLNYDLQVKISPFDTGQQNAYSKHYLLGLSFRVQADTSHSYGLSFFRSLAGAAPNQTPSWVASLPPAFQALRGDNIHLLLWTRQGPINTMEIIARRTLTPDDPVIEIRNGHEELRNYSTLLLQLHEQYNADGLRENVMSAYIQGLEGYPLWDSRDEMVWQEDTGTFPAPVQWENGQSEIRNGLYVSGDFNLLRPDEIGIHVLYDRTGANLKFFDDFAMRVENYAVVSGSQVQY